jgi:alpha/beta superfamily hydrolase
MVAIMDNKVVFTMARACRDNNIVAVRFNFRGVGRSEGVHDDGIGELARCFETGVRVGKKLHAALPDFPIILAGFSFGAAIAAGLAQTVQCCWFVAQCAPPVPRYGLDKM